MTATIYQLMETVQQASNLIISTALDKRTNTYIVILDKMSIPIHQIVCIDKNGGIGKNGNLPWKLEDDWQHFITHSLRQLVRSRSFIL